MLPLPVRYARPFHTSIGPSTPSAAPRIDLSSGTMATGGVVNAGACSDCVVVFCAAVLVVAGAVAAGVVAAGAAGVFSGAFVVTAGGVVCAPIRESSAGVAIRIAHRLRTQRDLRFHTRLRARSGTRRFTALAASCMAYMSKKLRIIWWPPSVSTLSGWNCTPSMGSVRCRRPIITVPDPFASVVRAVTRNSAGSDSCSTMSE